MSKDTKDKGFIRKKDVCRELIDYIRSGASLIYIVTNDERFTLQDIRRSVASLNLNKNAEENRTYGLYEWSCTQGTKKGDLKETENKDEHFVNMLNGNLEGKTYVFPDKVEDEATRDALRALDFFAAYVPNSKAHDFDCHVAVLKDLHPSLKDMRVVRKIKDIVVLNDDDANMVRKSLIILSPIQALPIELRNLATVIEWKLPARDEIMNYLSHYSINRIVKDDVKPSDKSDKPWRVEYTESEVETILTSLTGLSFPEIENVVTVSQIKYKEIRPEYLLESKKQMILKNGLLEYFQSDIDMEDVGGMDEIKNWLELRRTAFGADAKEFGIDTPRGLMMVGPPGCGKSYTAKATAKQLGVPLIRFDVGKVFSQTVGSSEANVREVIHLIEAVAPCVVFIDEIEKGLAGVASSNSSDAGTTARVVGTLLSWLNDKTSPVFVVATANNIRQLPPELSRKGRFDDIFFVSLPEASERKETFAIHLRKHKFKGESYNPADFDLDAFVKATDKWSNSECEQAIKTALIFAWNEGKKKHQSQKLENKHVIQAIKEGIPLSKTSEKEIADLYEWVGWDEDKKDGIRARYASKARKEVASKTKDSKLVFVDGNKAQ